MSTAVDTGPGPAPAEEEQRRCPRCGAPLTAEQEWCLECGAGVGATVAPAPSWRGPVALVVVLLAIAAAALVLALVELASDAEQVSEQPPTAQTPAPATTPAPAATPESTTIPPATEPGAAGIAEWPAGQEAWTIVLESSSTQEAATIRAQELSQQGIAVGILDSDEYGSLEPGRYVVFSGQYDTRRAAEQALGDLAGQVEGAYVRHVAAE